MNKLRIRFIVALNRINKEGNTAVGCRITYNKQKKQFSTGIFIKPYLWDSKSQLVKPPYEENAIINIQLGLINTHTLG